MRKLYGRDFDLVSRPDGLGAFSSVGCWIAVSFALNPKPLGPYLFSEVRFSGGQCSGFPVAGQAMRASKTRCPFSVVRKRVLVGTVEEGPSKT